MDTLYFMPKAHHRLSSKPKPHWHAKTTDQQRKKKQVSEGKYSQRRKESKFFPQTLERKINVKYMLRMASNLEFRERNKIKNDEKRWSCFEMLLFSQEF